MATKTLILVRHGQYHPKTEDGLERLTALGRKQARLAAKRLKENKIDRMVCSTMPRAMETATIIKDLLGFRGKLVQTDNLRECVPGFPKHLRKKHGRTDLALLKKHQKQADRAFAQFFKPSRKDSVEVLVCHGNVIRYLVCKTLGVETLTWLNMDIQQCGISTIQIRTKGDHRRLLISHNDVGHIPKAQRTFL